MKNGDIHKKIFCFGLNCTKVKSCYYSLHNLKRLKKYRNKLSFIESYYCINDNYSRYKEYGR